MKRLLNSWKNSEIDHELFGKLMTATILTVCVLLVLFAESAFAQTPVDSAYGSGGGSAAVGGANVLQVSNGAGVLAAGSCTDDGAGNLACSNQVSGTNGLFSGAMNVGSITSGIGCDGDGTPALNKLAKLISTTGCKYGLLTTADTAVPAFLISKDVSVAGTSGLYTAAFNSAVTATAEAAGGITAAHYVVRSPTTSGTMHDSGIVATGSNTPPTQCEGVANQTVAANATFNMTWNPECRATNLVAAGTAAMGTGAITSGSCAAAVTDGSVTSGVVANVATTDVIVYTPAVDPSGVTGYAVSATGSLYVWAYPTAGHVNFKVCNNTSGSLTPSALTFNWRVSR